MMSSAKKDCGLKAKNMADNVKALKPFAPKRKQFFRDDGSPTKKRHMVIRVIVETGPTLSHFSMQEHRFSSALGGPGSAGSKIGG